MDEDEGGGGVPPIDRRLIDAATRASGDRPVTITIEERVTEPVARESRSSSLDARGASLRTDHAEVASEFDSESGGYVLPWSGKRIGGGSASIDATVLTASGVNALHVLGGIVLVGAALAAAIPPRSLTLAAWLGVGGAAVIAAGTLAASYPWVLALAGVAMLGVVGYAAYAGVKSGARRRALDAIVPAIERAEDQSPEAARAIKDSVASAASGAARVVRAEVRAAKARAGVGS